jgi:hypothetical protein
MTTQLLREGKGDHEMMSGQLPLKLLFEPVSAFLVLAGGTVSVAARTKDGMNLSAMLTIIDGSAAIRCAALVDGLDHFKMLFGHTNAKAFDILRAVYFKDVINCRHGYLLSSDHL